MLEHLVTLVWLLLVVLVYLALYAFCNCRRRLRKAAAGGARANFITDAAVAAADSAVSISIDDESSEEEGHALVEGDFV